MLPGCICLRPEPWESAQRKSEAKLSSATMTRPTKATRISTWCCSLDLTFERPAYLRWCCGFWPWWMTFSIGYWSPYTTTHHCWTVTPWLWLAPPSQWAQTKLSVISSTALCTAGISVSTAHRNGSAHFPQKSPKTLDVSSAAAMQTWLQSVKEYPIVCH